MINELIYIDRQQADPIAEAYFCEICGFNRDMERFRPRFLDGLAVRDKINERINVRAVVSFFNKEAMKGKMVRLNDVRLECSALEIMDTGSIQGIYAFMLTAREMDINDSSMIDMFYADTWGTAFVDAGRDILQAELLEHFKHENAIKEELYISDSLGPGFYGMDVSEVRNFFRILDSDKVGIRMTSSGMMLPLKSTAGFYVIVDDKTQLPGKDCRSCLNNNNGCQFCRMKTR